MKTENKEIVKQRLKVLKALQDAGIKAEVNQSEQGRRSGLSRHQVSRFYQGEVTPTLDSVLKIAEAIGAKVVIKNNSGK